MAPSTQIPTRSTPLIAATHAHDKLEKHTIARLVLLDGDEIATEEEDSGTNSNEANH